MSFRILALSVSEGGNIRQILALKMMLSFSPFEKQVAKTVFRGVGGPHVK